MGTVLASIERKTFEMGIYAQNDLNRLAKAIRGHYHTTAMLVRTAQERSRAALAEAILCGKALNEAKALMGHGKWLPWLKKHCKGVCERTARNYMALANRQHDSDLNDARSLRQAYIAVGILNDSDPGTSGTPTKATYQTEPLADPTAPKTPSPQEVIAQFPRVTPERLLAGLEREMTAAAISINNLVRGGHVSPESVRPLVQRFLAKLPPTVN